MAAARDRLGLDPAQDLRKRRPLGRRTPQAGIMSAHRDSGQRPGSILRTRRLRLRQRCAPSWAGPLFVVVVVATLVVGYRLAATLALSSRTTDAEIEPVWCLSSGQRRLRGGGGRQSRVLAVYNLICILGLMDFTWSERKRRLNLSKHGFDFAAAVRVFAGPTLTVEDARDYDGEQRFNTTGFLGTAIVTICHTETADTVHIVSMRKAESHEIDTRARYL